MSVPLKPLGDYVVAQAEKAATKTASGLYIPESAQEKPQTAKVVAVGPGTVGDDNERVPLQVKVGDRIIYKPYSTNEVTVAGEGFILVKEEDILAVVGGK